MAGLVLDLGVEDGLAAQARGPGDPVALGLHADDLGVRVLGDLAHEGLAVGLGHGVAGLDAAVVGDDRVEGAPAAPASGRRPAVVLVRGAGVRGAHGVLLGLPTAQSVIHGRPCPHGLSIPAALATVRPPHAVARPDWPGPDGARRMARVTGPAYDGYFADPFVLRLPDGGYAAYGTGRPPPPSEDGAPAAGRAARRRGAGVRRPRDLAPARPGPRAAARRAGRRVLGPRGRPRRRRLLDVLLRRPRHPRAPRAGGPLRGPVRPVRGLRGVADPGRALRHRRRTRSGTTTAAGTCSTPATCSRPPGPGRTWPWSRSRT